MITKKRLVLTRLQELQRRCSEELSFRADRGFFTLALEKMAAELGRIEELVRDIKENSDESDKNAK